MPVSLTPKLWCLFVEDISYSNLKDTAKKTHNQGVIAKTTTAKETAGTGL